MLTRIIARLPRAQKLSKTAKVLSSAETSHNLLPATQFAIPKKSMSMVGPSDLLNKSVFNKYMMLDQKNSVILTYIWIDGTGEGLRGKSRTVDSEPKSVSQLSKWSFDGSSTGQAVGTNSDTFIHPVAMYPDPFTLGKNKIVLCDVYDSEKKPVATNNRASCKDAMDRASDSKPWFGIEQEYTMLDVDGQPLGWPKNGYPGPQGPYYCGIGAGKSCGREIELAHYKACLYAGINIGGTNAEVMPAQWEYQIGPCEGIDAADQLWFSRYLLDRIAEDFGVVISYDPKPMQGDWNGAGAHCNLSTDQMRTPGVGMKAMKEAIEKLEKRHKEHIIRYDPHGGEDNKRRLTGLHETASYKKFSWGVANRGVSVRIPRQSAEKGYGWIEDRRPSSNCDPYSVTDILVRTTCLDE